MTRIIKCEKCKKSVGFCVTFGCKTTEESKTAQVEIRAREWLGFEDC